MTVSCEKSTRRFGVIGAAFTAIGIGQPGFLPAGLALLVIAAVRRWRAGQRS